MGLRVKRVVSRNPNGRISGRKNMDTACEKHWRRTQDNNLQRSLKKTQKCQTDC